jgi:cytochrome c biogenesis protein CcmG, thiol:disulfide interchange protein DsbE
MILRLLVLAGWLLLEFSSQAASIKFDSLTIGSATYSNVTVLGANATDLFFTHDRGIANVKMKNLDAALQKQFQYDPEAADRAEKKQNAENSLYQSYVASNIVVQAEKDKAARAAQAAADASPDNLVDPISSQSLLGKSAPAMEADKWVGEKPALEGKFVLVSFWAPWSNPCRKWIPELNDLQKKFAEKLVVVGVTSASEAEITQMDGAKIEFACAIDSGAKFSSAVGVTSVPCVMLVDSNHKVRYQGHPGALSGGVLQGILEKPAE